MLLEFRTVITISLCVFSFNQDHKSENPFNPQILIFLNLRKIFFYHLIYLSSIYSFLSLCNSYYSHILTSDLTSKTHPFYSRFSHFSSVLFLAFGLSVHWITFQRWSYSPSIFPLSCSIEISVLLVSEILFCSESEFP